MNRELIERIDKYLTYKNEHWAFKTNIMLLEDCKSEINRLQLANETLSALNVEYLERVKALPKQEPVVYIPMSKEEHLAIAMQCMGADNWQQEAMEAVEVEAIRRMKEQGLI